MAKNNTIFFIILLLVLGLLFFGPKLGLKIPGITKDTGEDEKGVEITAYYENAKGEKVFFSTIEDLFATITFPGGTPIAGIVKIGLVSTITNKIASVDVRNIQLVGSPQPFESALNSLPSGTEGFILKPGESKIVDTGPTIDITSLNGDITFRLDVNGEFVSGGTATNPVLSPITTFGTLILNIKSDTCIDSTPPGQCSLTTQGKYCKPSSVTGVAPTLIDGATTYACGCPATQETSGLTQDSCIDKKCTDGTKINLCTFLSPAQYCNDQKTLVEDCTLCGSSCGTDYYGNPSTGCDLTTKKCTFATYSADISVSVGSGSTAFQTVKFRTNAVSGVTATTVSPYTSGTWIVVDYNKDGTLDPLRYYTSGSSSAICPSDSTYLLTTSGGLIINKYSTNFVRVCLNGATGSSFKTYSVTSDLTGIELSTTPTEPYLSNNQEIYS